MWLDESSSGPATIAPLTGVSFVDSNYGAATPNGAINAPFASVEDAIAAGTTPLQVMLLSPSETSEALVVPPGFDLSIRGSSSHDAPAQLASLTLGLGSKVQLENVNPGSIDAPPGDACFLSLSFPFVNGRQGGLTGPNVGTVDATGCLLQALGAGFGSDVSVGSLYAERCSLGSGGTSIEVESVADQTYVNSTFDNGSDGLSIVSGAAVHLKVCDLISVVDFTVDGGVFCDGWSWSTFISSASSGPLNVKNELQDQGSDGTLGPGALLEAMGGFIAAATAAGGGIIECDEDATTGTFQLSGSAGFILQQGGGSPVECTFSAWASGDVLFIEWQFQGNDFSGVGTDVAAGVRVSLDGGATFPFYANPASAGGESYNDNGGTISCLSGVLSVPIAGTTPPVVRLGYAVSNGQFLLSGPAANYTTGAVLHCERRAASMYRRTPPGALFS